MELHCWVVKKLRHRFSFSFFSKNAEVPKTESLLLLEAVLVFRADKWKP